MSLIKTLLKPHFKKTFGMDSVHIGVISANRRENTLNTEALGVIAGKVIHLKHPETKKLSDNEEHVSFFMDDVKDHIEFKEIITARLKFDFVKNKLTNTIQYVDMQNNEVSTVLESDI